MQKTIKMANTWSQDAQISPKHFYQRELQIWKIKRYTSCACKRKTLKCVHTARKTKTKWAAKFHSCEDSSKWKCLFVWAIRKRVKTHPGQKKKFGAFFLFFLHNAQNEEEHVHGDHKGKFLRYLVISTRYGVWHIKLTVLRRAVWIFKLFFEETVFSPIFL